MSALDDVVKKIRNLYALAQSSGGGEASAAVAAAEALIAKYKIERSQLGGRDAAVVRTEVRYKREVWYNILGRVLSDHHGIEAVGIGDGKCLLFGTEENLRMFRLQIDRAEELIRFVSVRDRPNASRAALNSYRFGMVIGLEEQLRKQRSPAAVASPGASTALAVVVNQDRARSAAARAALIPDHMLAKRIARPTDGREASEGMTRGKSLHIGDAMGPESAPRGALPPKA